MQVHLTILFFYFLTGELTAYEAVYQEDQTRIKMALKRINKDIAWLKYYGKYLHTYTQIFGFLTSFTFIQKIEYYNNIVLVVAVKNIKLNKYFVCAHGYFLFEFLINKYQSYSWILIL